MHEASLMIWLSPCCAKTTLLQDLPCKHSRELSDGNHRSIIVAGFREYRRECFLWRIAHLVIGNCHIGPWLLPHIPPARSPPGWHHRALSPRTCGFCRRDSKASIPFAQGQRKLKVCSFGISTISTPKPNPGGKDGVRERSNHTDVQQERPHTYEDFPVEMPMGTKTMDPKHWNECNVHMGVVHAKSSQQPRCWNHWCVATFPPNNLRGRNRRCQRARRQCPGAARCAPRTGCTRGSVAPALSQTIPIPSVCCLPFLLRPRFRQPVPTQRVNGKERHKQHEGTPSRFKALPTPRARSRGERGAKNL